MSKKRQNKNDGSLSKHLTREEKRLALTLYKVGVDFPRCSAEEAVELHREAAKQGWAPGQYNLACCYNNGKGVKKDPKKAVKWLRKAANQGNLDAQYNFGRCYKNGDGVNQDMLRAAKWFYKAAKQGDKDAKDALKRILDNDDDESCDKK